MKNILHAIDTSGPGGAETVFVALATLLDPVKYRSYAVIKSEGWVADQLRKAGVEPLFADTKGSFSLRYLWQLVRIIRRYKIDLIQSHLFGSNVYCSVAGVICRVPVVSVFHGAVDVSPGSRLLGAKFRLIRAGSACVVFVSHTLRDIFVRNRQVIPSQALVIYNGINTEVFQPRHADTIRDQLGFGANDVIVGSMGNIRKPKGYDVLMRAAALLKKQSPRYQFLIAGDTGGRMYEELLRLRKTLDLEQTVHFLGFRADVSQVLNNFDIFLLSSTSEGFSIATIEAMASGLPVVVTRSGGPEEIVTHENDGLLADTGSPEQLAAAIERVSRDSGLRKALQENARHTAVSRFSLKAMLAAYDRLYDRL